MNFNQRLSTFPFFHQISSLARPAQYLLRDLFYPLLPDQQYNWGMPLRYWIHFFLVLAFQVSVQILQNEHQIYQRLFFRNLKLVDVFPEDKSLALVVVMKAGGGGGGRISQKTGRAKVNFSSYLEMMTFSLLLGEVTSNSSVGYYST